MTRSRPGSALQSIPLTAVFTDSVPPAVNTTSVGCASATTANRSLASSSSARAARPSAWMEDGFPTRPSASAWAAAAAGSTGAEAAWSR